MKEKNEIKGKNETKGKKEITGKKERRTGPIGIHRLSPIPPSPI
jgi:hypothetical protein